MHRLSKIHFALKVIIVTSFLLIPLLIVNGILLNHYSKVAHERTAIGAERLARVIALQENRVIEGVRNMLSGISRFAEVQERGETGCDTTVALLLSEVNKSHIGQFLNLGVLDPNGNVVCSAISLTQPINAADRLYFRNAILTREFSVGEYQIGIVTKMRSLNFALPVLEENGAVKHVVFAALDLNSLGKDVGGLTIPGGASLTITDSRNKIIFRYPHEETALGLQWFPLDDEAKLEGNAEGRDIDGTVKMFGYSTLQPSRGINHLHVFVGLPLITPFAEMVSLSYVERASITVGFLLVPLFGWYAARMLRRHED